MPIPEIHISDYTYQLPDERIASYPAADRDGSKLLLYNKGIISDTVFSSIPDLLDENTFLVFNNTKVVPARLFFRKETGAIIEIFCLEPLSPGDYALCFASEKTCVWKTIVGNKRKWKGEIIHLNLPEGSSQDVVNLNLTAEIETQTESDVAVRFRWDGSLPFSRVLELCGSIPIPPYLHRESEAIDIERYQTLYALHRGSVAAPTAGLHFSDKVLNRLKNKQIEVAKVCLHVGAGTFLPVKSESIAEHTMHTEPFSISYEDLKKVHECIDNKKITSVGTTSVRTLESLYWLGADCLQSTPARWQPKGVEQWVPYASEQPVPSKEAFGALLEYMQLNRMDKLVSRTGIIIVPSYRFRVVNQLITNFHQPKSTLLLLIAALIGEDWRKVYDYALQNGFRFLSYGDSSLLIP